MTRELDLLFCEWLQLLLVSTWRPDLLFFSTFSSTLAYFYLGTNGTSVGVESIVAGPPTQLSPGWEKKTGPHALALASVEETTAFVAGKLPQ